MTATTTIDALAEAYAERDEAVMVKEKLIDELADLNKQFRRTMIELRSAYIEIAAIERKQTLTSGTTTVSIGPDGQYERAIDVE